MFNFLFGSSSSSGGRLILVPDESGKKLAGFHSGASLTLTAEPGETVGDVVDKFNTYRGPDQQIARLWTQDGRDLPFSTRVDGTVTAVVRAQHLK